MKVKTPRNDFDLTLRNYRVLRTFMNLLRTITQN